MWGSFLKSKDGWRHRAPSCVLCHDLADASYLCPDCAPLVHALRIDSEAVCPLCAKPSVHQAVCGHCQQAHWQFERLWASYRLAWPLHELIHEYKYQRQWWYASVFGQWLHQAAPPWLANAHFDAVIAMPLSRQRLLARGYNQVQLLAEALVPIIPLSATAISAVRLSRQHRPPQSTLHLKQRLSNVRGVFQLQTDVNKRNLLLIDDVVTTSATLNELARTLKLAGAHSVSCWVLARS